MRSVFFNVFQSLVVLLYILDNETNYVVIISVFIGQHTRHTHPSPLILHTPLLPPPYLPRPLGLCIELWKVTKVVEIRLDRQNLIGGILPRPSFVDRPSYQSSTKEYDLVSGEWEWGAKIQSQHHNMGST